MKNIKAGIYSISSDNMIQTVGRHIAKTLQHFVYD